MRQLHSGFGVKLAERPENVEAALWRRFRIEGEGNCREYLFRIYQEYAKKQATKQFYRRPSYGLDLSDFEQYAYTGLLQAIDKFDPLKNIPFIAYAKFRINGSISDGVATSSEIAAQYTHQQRMEHDRLNSLHTEEKVGDLDAISKLSDLVVGLAIGFILEDAGLLSDEKGEDLSPNAYETLSWRELQSSLHSEIEKLSDIERTVIRQHYTNGVAFSQIANMLGLSKGRVSQIHKKAIKNLRKRIRSPW